MDEVQNFFNTSVTIKWNSTGAGNFYVGQLPAVANGYLVVNRNSSSKREIIKYTGTGTDGNGPFITVLDAGDRGLGGTTAQTHEIGETVQMTITAQHWSDLIATLDGIVNDGAPTATTTVRGIVKMNTVPADPADPIVVGPNDPLLDKPTGEPTAFVTTSAGAGDEGRGVKLNASGELDSTFFKKPNVEVFNADDTVFGNSTSRFTINNPIGTVQRYTWDGVGTNPNINATTFPVGSIVQIQRSNDVSSAIGTSLCGVMTVIASGANYFEVDRGLTATAADRLHTKIRRAVPQTWTKSAGLSYITVEVQAGGASSDDSAGAGDGTAGGGAGGFSRKIISASSLGATETFFVGNGGYGGHRNVGNAGTKSSFGSHCTANGGATGTTSVGGLGGTSADGDLNMTGGRGGDRDRNYTSTEGIGLGGVSFFGSAGSGFGAGANGVSSSENGGDGVNGIVIVTEYYN